MLTILVNLRVKKEQYRVSLLAPIIGMCLKDVHCLSTVLGPADVCGSTCPLLFSSVFVSVPTAWCPCKCETILKSTCPVLDLCRLHWTLD